MTLTPTRSTPASIVPFTLTGTTNLETDPKTENLPLNINIVAGARQTHINGQFLTADTEAPIQNVVVNTYILKRSVPLYPYDSVLALLLYFVLF